MEIPDKHFGSPTKSIITLTCLLLRMTELLLIKQVTLPFVVTKIRNKEEYFMFMQLHIRNDISTLSGSIETLMFSHFLNKVHFQKAEFGHP